MKKARHSFAATLLLIALTISASAGQMDTGSPTAPPDAPVIIEEPAALWAEGALEITTAEIALDIWQFLPSFY